MRRRDFISLCGAAAVAWPQATRAQQPIPRIGVLAPLVDGDAEFKARDAAFRETLAKLGWTVGRNVELDYRFAASTIDSARLGAAEMVRSAPNVILAQNSLNAQALLRETRTIPIVFVNATDPTGSGLVSSLAHPGANATGFANYEFAIGGKWLDILKEISPATRRVLFLQAPGNVGNEGLLRSVQAAAPSLGVSVSAGGAFEASELERAIDTFAREPDGGLIVPPGAAYLERRELIVALTTRHRLPAIYHHPLFVAAGGLMSYGIDNIELYRKAASYVARILRGEKPGDLPVQIPTKFDFVINLKTARSLGLTIPLPLIGRADEVIE